MKKIFSLAFVLITLFVLTNTIHAVEPVYVSINSQSGNQNKINFSGTTSDDCTAVIIWVSDLEDNVIAIETRAVNNKTFQGALSVQLNVGQTYKIKAADYDSGPWSEEKTFVAKRNSSSSSSSSLHYVPNTGLN